MQWEIKRELLLSHGVVDGGRLHYEPTWNLEVGSISQL